MNHPHLTDPDKTFKTDLIALIPHLRAFARSLERGPDTDDLAQEAMLKAWNHRSHFQPGTSLKAWAFTILRNLFLSGKRRSWRNVPLERDVAENILVANDNPSAAEELLDVRNAMDQLPIDQREVLILIGAAQLSYEEVAQICSCAIGTVKSRVSRARAALTAILAASARRPRSRSAVSSGEVFENILQQAADLRRRLPLAA